MSIKVARPKRRGNQLGKLAPTCDFKETLTKRASRDPAFTEAMFDEAVTIFLGGEPHVACLILRNLLHNGYRD